jgi:hypothetical protein
MEGEKLSKIKKTTLIILLIIFVVILLIILLMVSYRNSNFSGEDEYQKNRHENDNAKMPIYTTIYFNDIDFRFFMNDFKGKMNNLIKSHFKNNHKTRQEILDTYEIKEEDEDEKSMDNLDKLWNRFHVKNPPILLVKYNSDKKRVTIIKDHRYFGGLFFLKMGGEITDSKPVTIYNEQYTPILSELLMLRFGLFWYTKNNKSKITMNPKNKIERVNFSLNFNSVKTDFKVRKQTIVMVEILKLVSNSLTINEKNLNVLTPIAFESTTKNYNNVGGIFTKYENKDTYKTYENKLKDNKYQAIATNNLQKIMSKGKDARNSIDVVFTCGCLVPNDKNNNKSSIIKSSMTSYLSVAHYPIYIVAMTMGDKCFVTITIMTENISLKKLENEIYFNKNISKIDI